MAISLRDEIIHIISTMLLAREGEVITPALADERARNLAQVLMGLYKIEEVSDGAQKADGR